MIKNKLQIVYNNINIKQSRLPILSPISSPILSPISSSFPSVLLLLNGNRNFINGNKNRSDNQYNSIRYLSTSSSNTNGKTVSFKLAGLLFYL